jgi:hypothetical protein
MAETQFLIQRLPDGEAGVVYRVSTDGAVTDRYDWAQEAWVDDPRVIEKLLNGEDLDQVTPTQAKAAIKRREAALAKAEADAEGGEE